MALDLKDLFGLYAVFAALIVAALIIHFVDVYVIKRRAKSEKSLAAGFRDMKRDLQSSRLHLKNGLHLDRGFRERRGATAGLEDVLVTNGDRSEEKLRHIFKLYAHVHA